MSGHEKPPETWTRVVDGTDVRIDRLTAFDLATGAHDFETVAIVCSGRERRLDDANLIAAGPDLLAACVCQKAVDDVFDGRITGEEYLAILTRHGWTGEHTEAFIKRLLSEAILKAEGASQ